MEIEVVGQMKEMSINNMELWDSQFQTDPSMTKQINKGSGRKITTIDAYWLIYKATKQWGPMGSWGLKSIDIKVTEGSDIGILSAVFFHPSGSFAIGNSINRFIGRNDKKREDDEWVKKIVTNTISKALSYLGFSADVYFGKFDDDRYVADTVKAVAADLKEECLNELAVLSGSGVVDETQHAKLVAKLEASETDLDALHRARAYIKGLA